MVKQAVEEGSAYVKREVERRKATGEQLNLRQFGELMGESRRRVKEADLAARKEGPVGEASAVAPFTARSLNAAVEVVRQGQCTRCSMVMQTQQLVLSTIIGWNKCIDAYRRIDASLRHMTYYYHLQRCIIA